MTLNLKNPKTCGLAHELAELTGESLTTAITEALRERLERIRKRDSEEERYQRIHAIVLDMQSRFKEPYRSMDWDEYLYDERGLPK